MLTLRILVLAFGGAAVVLTGLALVPSNDALVRMWDFPRVQLAAVLAAAALASPWVLPRRAASAVFAAAVLTALAWQAAAIVPYTPLATTQVKAAQSCEATARLSLLTANVFMHNDNAQVLRHVIAAADPDVILLLETDESWDRRIAFLNAAYPHTVRHPLANTYGLHLFSRLPLVSPKVRHLVEEDVPSIKTGLRLRSGARVELYGVHPKPPPLQDTAQRDAELVMVAREVAASGAPSIVMGDLNDVAWSDTTRLFQDVSRLLDPRIGRSPYATFNANWPLLRWPLDHVFFSASFKLEELAVLGDIGSDHFPVFTRLCFSPGAGAQQAEPRPEPEDLEEAAEVVAEGREEEAEDEEDKQTRSAP